MWTKTPTMVHSQFLHVCSSFPNSFSLLRDIHQLHIFTGQTKAVEVSEVRIKYLQEKTDEANEEMRMMKSDLDFLKKVKDGKPTLPEGAPKRPPRHNKSSESDPSPPPPPPPGRETLPALRPPHATGLPPVLPPRPGRLDSSLSHDSHDSDNDDDE